MIVGSCKRKSQRQKFENVQKKYDPAVCIRTSMANYRNEDNELSQSSTLLYSKL